MEICTTESLNNALWKLGVRAVRFSKRAGFPGTFERLMESAAYRLIPATQQEIHVRLPTGLTLIVPPAFPRARSYATGVYEEEVTRLFHKLVTGGMTVVDVGSFCGYYALLASHIVGNNGRVYAFEPDPCNFSYLVRNIGINECRNVFAVNQAVADRSGSGLLALHVEADHHALVLSKSSAGQRMGETALISVQTTTLDDYFEGEGWPRVDLVKMDIEGGEKDALEGMRKLSSRSPRMCLIMEYSARASRLAGSTRKALASVLSELGFRSGYVIEQGMRLFSVPEELPATSATYDLLFKKE